LYNQPLDSIVKAVIVFYSVVLLIYSLETVNIDIHNNIVYNTPRGQAYSAVENMDRDDCSRG